jgi:hypothetical protein
MSGRCLFVPMSESMAEEQLPWQIHLFPPSPFASADEE